MSTLGRAAAAVPRVLPFASGALVLALPLAGLAAAHDDARRSDAMGSALPPGLPVALPVLLALRAHDPVTAAAPPPRRAA